jgi:adenosylcobyric acid synthase
LESLPDVIVYYTRRPEDARHADVLILPGSKNTIPDLLWLRANGWEAAIRDHSAAGKPVVGICGGFQMLGTEIRDPHRTESDIEAVPGLKLLEVITTLAPEKVTRQATARFVTPKSVAGETFDPLFTGYEIHLGETLLINGAPPLFKLTRLGDADCQLDGAINQDGNVLGTYLHGLFDSAEGLAWLVNQWQRMRGKALSDLRTFDPHAERERRYDALAEHYRNNMKMNLVYRALDQQR